MIGKIKEIYRTTDNKIFENRREAENYQNSLNHIVRRNNFILYDSLVKKYEKKSNQELQDIVGKIIPLTKNSIFHNGKEVHNRVRPYYCKNSQSEELPKIVAENVLKIRLYQDYPDNNYLQVVNINDFIHIYYKGNYNIISPKKFIRKVKNSNYISFNDIKNDSRINISPQESKIFQLGEVIVNEKIQQLLNLKNKKSAKRLTLGEWIALSNYFEEIYKK